MASGLTRFGRWAVLHPFWGNFLLGCTLPLFVFIGALEGAREGFYEWQIDRKALQAIVRRAAPTGEERHGD